MLSRNDLLQLLNLAGRDGSPTPIERLWLTRIAEDLNAMWKEADRLAAEAKKEQEEAAASSAASSGAERVRVAEWTQRSPNPGQNEAGDTNPHAPGVNAEIDATTQAGQATNDDARQRTSPNGKPLRHGAG